LALKSLQTGRVEKMKKKNTEQKPVSKARISSRNCDIDCSDTMTNFSTFRKQEITLQKRKSMWESP